MKLSLISALALPAFLGFTPSVATNTTGFGSNNITTLARQDQDDDGPPLTHAGLKVKFESDSDADLSLEEELFLAQSLVDSFRTTHSSHMYLTAVQLHGHAQKETNSNSPPNLPTGVFPWIDGIYWDISFLGDMFGCGKKCVTLGPNGSPRTPVNPLPPKGTDKEDRTPHENWEHVLCKTLRKGEYSVFQAIRACTIDLEEAKAEEGPVLSTPATYFSVGDVNINDAVIVSGYKTDNENDHTSEEIEYESYCLISSFHETHNLPEMELDSVTFKKETHQPVSAILDAFQSHDADSDASKHVQNFYNWFAHLPRFSCKVCPLSMYDFLMTSKEKEDSTTTLLRGGKKKTSHELWEDSFCQCLSKIDAFVTVAECHIEFKNDNHYKSMSTME